ncbi:MAG: fatty acid desaturase [Chthoniobacterales bacterium]
MKKIHWLNTAFLFGTFFTTLIGVPLYFWHYGLDWFQTILFLFFFYSTGMSITLGYHRLFSHLTFNASMPVRLYTLIFGAAAFEGSALEWCADHRRHHKFVGHEEDPYDIGKGFWHAHIGWLLFRHGPDTPLTWVRDLQKDKLVVWQHRYFVPLGVFVSFVLPPAIGYAWGGWPSALGSFLLAGVARVVIVHHMTFCINSLCHWTGSRPYSSESSARDSFFMAIFTFGEGYHNYHHEFQHDYRNGVKPWQFDPTKWAIRALQMFGLVRNLRTVPRAKILQAEITEQRRRIDKQLAANGSDGALMQILHSAQVALDEAFAKWAHLQEEFREVRDKRIKANRERREVVKRQLREASERLGDALRHWRETCGMLELAG